MKVGTRYRIGEFARLGATSIKTLRFYDELGLLKPDAVDARTRYRYYGATQLRDLAAIHALKDLGASLEDIRRVLTLTDGDRGRRKLLTRLHADAVRKLRTTRRTIEWLELALEDAMHAPPDIPIVLKLRGELRVASIRASLASYAEIVPVERELTRGLHPSLTGDARGVLWHRCEASGAIDGEPFVELRGQTVGGSGIVVRQLPAAHMASAYCESDDAAAVRTYDAIDRWIHRHSLRLDGPKREIYIGQLLEIQFPVRPA